MDVQGSGGCGVPKPGARAPTRTLYIRPVAAIAVACAMLVAAQATAARAREPFATPTFLVATPDMPDPLFAHSVILMLPAIDPPLVAGVIINRPTTVPVRELFPHSAARKNKADHAYFGGPVEVTGPLLLLRSAAPPGTATRVFGDIYVSTAPDSIAAILKDSRSAEDLRLFVGRAQWTHDQLHAEILEGSWYVVPAQAGLIFSPDPQRVWHVLVERAQLQEVEAPATSAAFSLALLCCARW
jgi:putative transcriptional regulator